jgi:hypothetical protein
MSAPDAGVFPRPFTEFVAARYTPYVAQGAGVCDSCGSPHVVGEEVGGDLHCAPCQKGMWTAEQSEMDVIYEMVRGAVEGALRLTSPEIVRAAAVAALLDAIAGED